MYFLYYFSFLFLFECVNAIVSVVIIPFRKQCNCEVKEKQRDGSKKEACIKPDQRKSSITTMKMEGEKCDFPCLKHFLIF